MDLLFRQCLEQARLRPVNTVLSGPGGRLSYGELDARAANFAAGLRARGIGQGELVGLCLDWAPDLLTAVLGTWQAGAAYVPLDPVLPPARLDAMLGVAKPAAIVVPRHWQHLYAGQSLLLLSPEEVEATGDGQPEDGQVDPSHLAYVMFTSGTSGTPKGVMVSHANLAGLFEPFIRRFDWRSDDAWSLCHSYAFGYSIWETWGALTTGARLVPVPAAWRADPVQLNDLLASEGITILSQTPSAFRQTVLHEDFEPGKLQRLRLIALSGEAVPAADLRRWFARRGRRSTQLISTYAITETSGQLTCRVYEPANADEAGPGSVGEPLPGVDLRLLGDDGREVAEGETGELYVAGAGVAQGYLGDASQTQDRFVDLPVGANEQRFYRTGDLARRSASGGVVFAGRADGQLKWLGYRMEPSEVEAALQSHPAVREAAVALSGGGDHKRLVGYYAAGARTAAPGEPEFWPAIGPYQVYDEFLYDLMSTDAARLAQFRQAYARQAAGRTVLDIGTGEHALLARLCVEAGARHVYAVEVLPEAAAAARKTVASLGLKKQITVIEGAMDAVNLPESVDLATQGIIGNIGSADGIIPIWNAARRFFLPGCLPVPARCRSQIAPVELPPDLAAAPAFTPLAQHYAKLVYEQRGGTFDIRLCVRNFPATGLLAEPAEFEDLDFHGDLAPPALGGAEFHAQRAGRLDGLLIWTEVDLGAGDTLDYLANQQAWLPVFLPLPGGGVPVAKGERIELGWQRDDAAGLCPDYYVRVQLESGAHDCVSRHLDSGVNGTQVHRSLHAGESSADPGPEVLRAWLAERLPAYMVPTAWVNLPALPLTANGKLDRDRLPEPGQARPPLAAAAVAPRDELEARLTAIWRNALELDTLGVEDNFFDLGGDSIAAVRVISMVQRELDAPVGLAALFDAPTVAELAGFLRDQAGSAGAAAMEEGTL